MQTIKYSHVPYPDQFQRDSSVMLAVRSHDPILSHLDQLLGQFHVHELRRDGVYKVMLCDLFVTANYWLKSYYAKHPAMKRERFPAISALFEIVTVELVHLFGCQRPEVGQRITELFGRDLTHEGMTTDRNRDGHFYDTQVLKTLRLRFKAGRVYHYETNPRRGAMRLVPVESDAFYEPVAVKRDGVMMLRAKGWAPFVMTLESEFYMSRHTLDKPGAPNIFHSAYTRGGTVASAGTMFVKNGHILGIRGDSGHYHPRDSNIAQALTALSMLSVPLTSIMVLKYDEDDITRGMDAPDFLRGHLTWAEFDESRQDFQKARRIAAIRNGNPPGGGGVPMGPVVVQNLPPAEHEDLYQT